MGQTGQGDGTSERAVPPSRHVAGVSRRTFIQGVSTVGAATAVLAGASQQAAAQYGRAAVDELSVEQLTAGIAHNIRNPLSAVKHASQLLAESPDLGEEDQHLLNIIQRNSGRIDGIVESILQLSRGHPPEFQTIDLALWLKELHAELRESRQLPHERLQLDIATDTPRARANAGHLHQILANLCDNAIKHARTADQPARLCLSAESFLRTR